MELIDHGFAANESDAAQKALWAGVDMSMQSGLYREYIPTLINEGRVAMDTLDTAVRRVLRVKAKMGLFDDPYRSLDLAREAADSFMPEHDALARNVAVRSVVMLKNEGSVLPLKKAGQKVAVVGWWIDDQGNEEGCGVIWGNASFVTTLADGISNAMKSPATEFKKVQANTVESVLDGTCVRACVRCGCVAWHMVLS